MLKHKILRQPVRYAVGVLIMLLAVSILCVTVGQGLYAAALAKETEEKHVTIAVPGLEIQSGGNPQYGEVTAFVEDAIANSPGLVRQIVNSDMASAYIPELTLLNNTAF